MQLVEPVHWTGTLKQSVQTVLDWMQDADIDSGSLCILLKFIRIDSDAFVYFYIKYKDVSKQIFLLVSGCIWIIVQDRIGQPLPITSIFANERLLGDNSVEASYQIQVEDVSQELSFSCDWSQVGPGGEQLYRGRETSQTVSIVLPPVLDNGTIERWLAQSEYESYILSHSGAGISTRLIV